MRIQSLGFVLPHGLALGTSLCISEHGLQVFSTVIHSIQVFGFLQVRSSGQGHCKWDSDWYFYHSF